MKQTTKEIMKEVQQGFDSLTKALAKLYDKLQEEKKENEV